MNLALHYGYIKACLEFNLKLSVADTGSLTVDTPR